MIQVIDNFLPKEVFENVQKYVNENEFEVIEAGDKSFCALAVTEDILKHFVIQGMDMTFAFIRKAYNGFDEDLRIHNDGVINGRLTDLASVFYINPSKGVTPNGTMFYEHKKHGSTFSGDLEEFNRLLSEESNDKKNWKETDKIVSKPNRLLLYSANQFHSKYPSKISKGERIVMVVFYSKTEVKQEEQE